MSETIPHSAEAYHPDGESYRDLWKLSHSNVGRIAKRANELRAERDKWKAEGEDIVQMLIQRDKEADAALAELASVRALLVKAGEAARNAAQTLRQVPAHSAFGAIAWKDAVELELLLAEIRRATNET